MSQEVPISAKLTYTDYVRICEDGLRHEIVDGVDYVNPAPGTYHQTISKRLQYELYRQIELAGLGVVFYAPVDVELSDHDIVQPDLLAILNDHQSIVTPAKIFGVPDLVVEITSPSTKVHDQRRKKALYERVGVPEYWLIDPQARRVTVHRLVAGKYEVTKADTSLTWHACPQVVVNFDTIW